MNDRKVVILGQLGATHGVAGFLKVNSYTDPAANIFHYDHWLIGTSEQNLKEISVLDKQIRGLKLVAKLAGCDDCDKARLYTGYLIGVYRNTLPEPDVNEYYWTDLEGCEVFNEKGVSLGRVDHLMNTGSPVSLMVVKSHQQDRLIPFQQGPVVKHVDLIKKSISVAWDEDF